MGSHVGVGCVLILVSDGQQSLWKMNIAVAYEIPVLIDLGWLCGPLKKPHASLICWVFTKLGGHEGRPLFVKSHSGYIYLIV